MVTPCHQQWSDVCQLGLEAGSRSFLSDVGVLRGAVRARAAPSTSFLIFAIVSLLIGSGRALLESHCFFLAAVRKNLAPETCGSVIMVLLPVTVAVLFVPMSGSFLCGFDGYSIPDVLVAIFVGVDCS